MPTIPLNLYPSRLSVLQTAQSAGGLPPCCSAAFRQIQPRHELRNDLRLSSRQSANPPPLHASAGATRAPVIVQDNLCQRKDSARQLLPPVQPSRFRGWKLPPREHWFSCESPAIPALFSNAGIRGYAKRSRSR